MNFGLSDEQRLLQQSARSMLASECTPAAVRQAAADPDGFPRDLYRKLAGLGWLGMLVPDALGGIGGSMLDAALLFEEAGRAALPGPLLSAGLLAPLALRQAGSRSQQSAWLPRLAAGDAIGTVAILEKTERYDPTGITARARRVRDGYRLSGVKMFVPDAQVADFIIVAARSEGSPPPQPARARAVSDRAAGISLFLVDRRTAGLAVERLDTIDGTRRLCAVALRNVRVPTTALVGRAGAGWSTLALLLDAAAVAIAADSLGGAQRVLEMSIAYAREREQFGRPIGAFQAIKHMAAEMVAEIEPARALVWYAAYAFDARPGERSRAASLAKARLGDVYSRAANRAVQIHGGIGFTWEHDLHWWFKRAKFNEAAFGDPTLHREHIARLDNF